MSKLSNNISKFLAILLTLVIALSIPYSTQTVYAGNDDANAGGGGAGGGGQTSVGGASVNKCGYRMYVLDSNGHLVSNVVDLVIQQPVRTAYNYSTRLGGGTTGSIKPMPSGMPTPYIYDGKFKGNGNALRAWFYKRNSTGNLNMSTIIWSYLGGQQMLDKFNSADTYYLAVEPIAWHNVYTTSNSASGTREIFYGTFYNWIQYYSAHGYGKTFTSTLDTNVLGNCLKLIHDQLGLTTPGSQSGLTLSGVGNQGYGIQLYSNKDKPTGGIQTTCDEDVMPSKPVHPAPNESVGDKTIVKNYRTVIGGDIYDDGCEIKTSTAPIIGIEEEDLYKVVGWKTSNVTERISSVSWPVPGTIVQHGSEAGSTVTLGGSETTLYVLLERKNENVNEGFILHESQISRGVRLSNPDIPGSQKTLASHQFVWISAPLRKDCVANGGNGHSYIIKHPCDGHQGKAKFKRNTSHTGGYTEPDLGHPCYPGPNVGDWDHDGYETDYCPDRNDCKDKRETGYEKCSDWKVTDGSMTLRLTDTISNVVENVVVTNNWKRITDSTSSTAAFSKNVDRNGNLNATRYAYNGLDYICTIHRGKDDLTLVNTVAKNSLAGNNGNLTGLGYKTGNRPQGTRQMNGTYNGSFLVTFTDGASDRTTASTPQKSGEHTTEKCGTFSIDAQFLATSVLKVGVDVTVEVYQGQDSLGDTSTVGNRSSFATQTVGHRHENGVQVKSSNPISFYPYIRMQYNVLNSSYTPIENKQVNVEGQHLRTIVPNSYACVVWEEPAGGNGKLNINSLQWSTHAQAIEDKGLNKVLPGGATYSLGIKKDDYMTVNVVTYQPIVVGDGKTQVVESGCTVADEYSLNNVKTWHDNYANDVIDALELLNVQQWVAPDGDTSENVWEMSNKVAVTNDTNLLSALNAASRTNSDKKYYFSNDMEQGRSKDAAEGDLDVQKETKTIKYYTFYTRPDRRYIYMHEETNESTLNKAGYSDSERITDLNGNIISGKDKARDINFRTGIVDKMLACLELGTGFDETAGWTNEEESYGWYNEAFNGITIVEQTTPLKVGFLEPFERTSVLDPALTPKSAGQSEMFKVYNVTQFKMRPFSDKYPNKNNKVGEFKGTEVYMQGMDILYKSDKFYIPNVNVQDLH